MGNKPIKWTDAALAALVVLHSDATIDSLHPYLYFLRGSNGKVVFNSGASTPSAVLRRYVLMHKLLPAEVLSDE